MALRCTHTRGAVAAKPALSATTGARLDNAGDPQRRVRERIAEWFARPQGLRFTRFRTMTALSRGRMPGPDTSIHKLVNAGKLQDIASPAGPMRRVLGLPADIRVDNKQAVQPGADGQPVAA